MGSLAKKTDRRRTLRKARMGKDRKRIVRRDGTTPKFPIHVEEKKSQAS